MRKNRVDRDGEEIGCVERLRQPWNDDAPEVDLNKVGSFMKREREREIKRIRKTFLNTIINVS